MAATVRPNLTCMKLKMPRMGGLPMPEASLPKVPGAPAPVQKNPMKTGEQAATAKTPKSKSMADATDKPSVFFKAESDIKKPSIQNLKTFLENSKQKKQSSHSNERLSMDHDKKISAQEAGQAVLKKVEELLKASKLAKATVAKAEMEKCGDLCKSKMAKGEDCEHKAKMAKAEHPAQANVTPPDGVQAQRTPPDNFNGNPAPGADPKNLGEPYKGHIKLAKFVGRMEAKRQQKAVPNG